MKSIRAGTYKEIARANLRGQLLDAASRILAAEGAENLGIRRITDEVGASTMVFYSTFGNKQGLMEALWLEGFERFWLLQQEVLELNLTPFERVLALCRVYRTNALTNPEYFSITFGGAIKADIIPEAVRTKSRRVLDTLVQAVNESMEDGQLTKGDALEVATSLWSSAHGYCTLELAKFLEERASDEVFERHITANIRSYLVIS
ncbi:hypothetical protein BH11CYA1_BH11CYA1_43540 [soil metagenome]